MSYFRISSLGAITTLIVCSLSACGKQSSNDQTSGADTLGRHGGVGHSSNLTKEQIDQALRDILGAAQDKTNRVKHSAACNVMEFCSNNIDATFIVTIGTNVACGAIGVVSLLVAPVGIGVLTTCAAAAVGSGGGFISCAYLADSYSQYCLYR